MGGKEPLLSVARACAYLNCGTDWMYKSLQSGAVRGSKVAGRWKIEPKELDRLLKMGSNASNRFWRI